MWDMTRRHGCLAGLGLVAVAVLAAVVLSAVAVVQNRSTEFEHAEPEPVALPDAGSTPVRLRLESHTAGVSVKPGAAGGSIRVDADYDPRRHELRQDGREVDGTMVLTVSLRPIGSKLMALMRAKLGGRPAKLRVSVPRDVALEIDGELIRSFAAIELGGMAVSRTRFDVKEGGVKVSFSEPLVRPMERFSITGDMGSISVSGLGNASPRETRLVQHLGALDIDLRGAWANDASVRILGAAAGGSLWLPDNASVVGLDTRHGVRLEETGELARPRLDLEVTEHAGRLVVMD